MVQLQATFLVWYVAFALCVRMIRQMLREVREARRALREARHRRPDDELRSTDTPKAVDVDAGGEEDRDLTAALRRPIGHKGLADPKARDDFRRALLAFGADAMGVKMSDDLTAEHIQDRLGFDQLVGHTFVMNDAQGLADFAREQGFSFIARIIGTVRLKIIWTEMEGTKIGFRAKLGPVRLSAKMDIAGGDLLHFSAFGFHLVRVACPLDGKFCAVVIAEASWSSSKSFQNGLPDYLSTTVTEVVGPKANPLAKTAMRMRVYKPKDGTQPISELRMSLQKQD